MAWRTLGLTLFVALSGSLLAFPARAIGLGELRSTSRTGEVLRAELEVRAHPAERFDPACLKLYRPEKTSDDLPWLTAARLSYRRDADRGTLSIVSQAPVGDPVIHIGLRSECGAEVLRQYTLTLAAPVAAATPPARGRDAAAPPASPGEEANALRLTDELSAAAGGTDSRLSRDLLRLEHRALQLRSDPLLSEEALNERLAWLEANVAELKRAEQRLAAAAGSLPDSAAAGSGGQSPAESSGAPAVSAAPRAPAPASRPVPPPADDELSWLLYGGLAVVLPLVLLVLFHRRRVGEAPAAAPQAPFSVPDSPTTIAGRVRREAVPFSAGAAAERAAGAAAAGETPLRAAPSAPDSQRRPASPVAAPEPSRVAVPGPAEAPPTSAAPLAEPASPPVLNLPEAQPSGAAPALELAEIMLSFGRVGGAARTLEEFLAEQPQESLRPWIRLLEIYQENGMREEFEALTQRLNRNFNVEILRWDRDRESRQAAAEPAEMSLVEPTTIEEIPRIRDQIVTLWGTAACSEYLEKLLRDNRDGGRRGFSLPIVEEILLLSEIAASAAATHQSRH
ncbi:FimV family protein [Accumulibacter sp.]|uniref:type IV pilus assembly protein FimV n=1 Tax=Accumulibacter sp. TaxID=2053492 RepID=UPI0025D486F3|nr:hypothetical protein [Accumulibacter sp.]MCM8594896.1 hypothetical protein [Accumulibacter sp.]MCM8627838.1 hypothetical protein [Accumulibacter sp.]MDS4049042.1 hypothetical protein [Accumulibacter sp.]